MLAHCGRRLPGRVGVMPELPDITVYIEALERRLLGARLESTRITHPFLLRTFDPPMSVALWT